MLQQILNEIRSGGTLSTDQLAVRLGTSPEFVAAMLEHLQRTGLIHSYADCAAACQGCSLQSACEVPENRKIILWQSKPEG